MRADSLVLTGRPHDLGGGMVVRRLLPAAQCRSVGPFVFFDHFGPALVGPDGAQDVRPHPHIGLGTVTYLLEGALLHRDSLGTTQRIEPGALNWMRAGRGIVHSERRPPGQTGVSTLHGLQFWLALPQALEEAEPAFHHTPAAAVPQIAVAGAQVRVLLGEAWGAVAAVETGVPALCLDVSLPAGAALSLPALAPELAVYAVEGALQLDAQPLSVGSLRVLPGDRLHSTTLQAGAEPARCMVLGGAPLDAPRYLWWNFVSSRRERIQAAAAAWEAGQMPPIPGETERIALPPRRFNP